MTKRNMWLIITSLTIGPAFGGLTFIVLAGVTDALFVDRPRGPTVAGLEDYWPMVLIGAYVLGAIPAVTAAGLTIYLTRRVQAFWQRLLVASAIGGAISCAALSFLLLGYGGIASFYGLMIAGVIFASGAVAGAASLSIVELFHPLPAKVGG
jgi:hypothetical protein